MPNTPITVLVVDSNDRRRHKTLNELKKRRRLHVEGVSSVRGAIQVLDTVDIDSVVSHRRLDDGIATNVFRYAAKKKPGVGKIFVTQGEHSPLLLQATDIAVGHVDLDINRPYEKLSDLIVGGYDYNAFAPYPVPTDEDKRIEAVEKYKDSGTHRLNALVDQAADEFGVEKVSVRLVKRETLEHLSCHGFVANNIDRQDAICTHTIMDGDVTVIPNVQNHPLFEDVEELRAMDINWYAGAVIQLEGQNIGTFCLEDSEQQKFTDKKRQRLQDYASHAAALIALEEALEDADIHSLEEAVGQAQTKA